MAGVPQVRGPGVFIFLWILFLPFMTYPYLGPAKSPGVRAPRASGPESSHPGHEGSCVGQGFPGFRRGPRLSKIWIQGRIHFREGDQVPGGPQGPVAEAGPASGPSPRLAPASSILVCI